MTEHGPSHAPHENDFPPGPPPPGTDLVPVTSDYAFDTYRAIRRMLVRNPLARMAVAIPRTARFIAQNFEQRLSGAVGGHPVPSLSPTLAASVAMDEAILGLAMGPNRFPRRADYVRVGGELAESRAFYESNGWLEDPASYHRTPPPLLSPKMSSGWTVMPALQPAVPYESMHFDSGFEPYPGEPGRERWLEYEPNRRAGAWVMRHDGEPRPWLVCLHGFAMGYPIMDFNAFGARHLHEELGLNLVFPVLPLHGHRKVTPMSGEAFLSFDLVNTVHGLAQSAWDIRRVISWVRAQEAPMVGLYGVSLGGYVAALVAGLEPDLDCVISGVPVCDFPRLFRQQSPYHIRLRAIEHNILGGAAEEVHKVVSPLALEPLVAKERRFVYAGLGDRVTGPGQAHWLWEHWDRPKVLWYHGNHIGFLLSGEVGDFVRQALDTTGFTVADSEPLD